MKSIRNARLALCSCLALSALAPSSRSAEYIAYVGTYTGANSNGIYAYRFDSATGKLTSLGLAGESSNPSFVAVHPNHRFLYAVSELDTFGGKKSGAVNAFSIDSKSG